MWEFYEIIKQDFEVVQGDTLNMKFSFKDKNKVDLNNIAAQNWQCTLNIEDPISGDLIAALAKSHNDITPAGDGIYYNNDVYSISGLGITQDNQIAAVVPSDEIETLLPLVYPYYIKFLINQAYQSAFTAVRGNIIVLKRNT